MYEYNYRKKFKAGIMANTVLLTLKRLKQEDHELQASLECIYIYILCI